VSNAFHLSRSRGRLCGINDPGLNGQSGLRFGLEFSGGVNQSDSLFIRHTDSRSRKEMPNLAGIFDMTSRPTETVAAAARLVRVLGVVGVKYVAREWHDERFAAVNLLNGICGNLDQPAISATGNVVLFLDGEISNLAEEWQATTVDLEVATPSPARACLDLCQQYGDGFVKRLDGQFNVLLYDCSNRSVKVFNDRLAYRPFYYWCADGLAVFGLEKKALFAARGRTPPFDPMGTLEFMAFGHNLDDRTVFAGVEAMPQGSVVEFKDSRVTARRYWRPAYDNRTGVRSLEEGALELGRRLSRAVTRRTQGTRSYGIFLSGGLDSRAVAGALAGVRRDIASFTFGKDDSPDLRYGRELAAKLGFPHYRLAYDDISLTELLPRVVWRTEGSISFNETYSIAQHEYIRPKAAVIFNGHFGDAISGGHLLPGQFLARNKRQLAEHIVAKRSLLHLPTLRVLFRSSFLDDAHLEMVRGIERSLVSLEEDRLPLAHNLWDMTVRQRRFTFSSPAVDRYVVEQVTPFTDNDVVDLMLSLPVRHLFGQRVYKRMILQTFPEIAGVPWAKTGHRLSTSLVVDMAVQARLYVAKRIRRTATRAEPTGTGPGSGDLKTYIDTRFSLDAFAADLFDRDAIQRVIQAALDGSGSAAPLFVLLTLAECARLFGTGGLTEPPPETRPVL